MAASRLKARARVGFIVVVVALAGCGASEPTEQPLATYAPGTGPSMMDALMGGTVDLIDGCLVIRPEGLDEPVVPVFDARGATWDGEALTYEGRRYEVGDPITVGGGSAGAIVEEAPESLVIPDACASDWGVWAAAGLSR